MHRPILILDFGSQTTQLIARRLREAHVFCEILPCDAPEEKIRALLPQGFILSGGPASVYDPGAPQMPAFVLESGLPVLGICYGLQLIAHTLGGKVAPGSEREYGHALLNVPEPNALLPAGSHQVWMSHGDRVEALPSGFTALASSPGSPVAAIVSSDRRVYGIQFHPEVRHTAIGAALLRNFALRVCAASADWTPANIVSQAVADMRAQVGEGKALAAVSGGVDSSVASALAHRALGPRLTALFVDNGLLRQGERASVESALRPLMGDSLHVVDAAQTFLAALKGHLDPERKRRAVGRVFIDVFIDFIRSHGGVDFLVQGTIYPDVIESRAPERVAAHKIKSHHNVGGLPASMPFKLVEPLRYLFKDEVRAIGEHLGLPAGLLWRQPFPGPGLAVRCLGRVTPARLETLRRADAIFCDELRAAGLLEQPHAPQDSIAQAFAALLPVRSVGVMGDQRTYQETVVLRAVSTQDFMTAGWVPLPHDLLGRAANRIVNEVPGVNRVVYDLTSKPPATIEWE